MSSAATARTSEGPAARPHVVAVSGHAHDEPAHAEHGHAHGDGVAHGHKKHKPHDPPPPGASEMWLVSLADLLSLLLCFFIMMLAFSASDSHRRRVAIGSLLGSFGILPEGVGVDASGSYVATVEHISLNKEVTLFAAFEAMLEADEWKSDDVKVIIDDSGHRRIRFNDRFLFRTGSNQLDPRVFPLLDKLAAILRELGRPVEVEGHTDATRRRRALWLLSSQRAAAVVRYFEEACGLEALRLTAVGLADTRALVTDPNADPTANRRVEVVVY